MSEVEVEQGAVVDIDLTMRALAGEQAAFEELYRRHAPAAWRVAHAVAGDPDDAADAVSDAFTRVLAAVQDGRYAADAPFRPYLLATTRNAAIDGLRRRRRDDGGDVLDLTDEGDTRWGHDHSGEAVVDGVDRALIASAFRSLPDRWRAVLWLTEVEGVPPREAAEMLGLSPNGVAQLAVRARAGLRVRYLQAHLGTEGCDEECRRTIRHLGAYVAGGLAPRDTARVDQHLAGCAECRERVEELREVGGAMPLLALPLPLVVLGASADRWQTSLAASTSEPTGASTWLTPRGRAARLAGGWAAVVFAIGTLSLPDWGGGDSTPDDRRGSGRPPAAAVADVGVLGTSVLADPALEPSNPAPPAPRALPPKDGDAPAGAAPPGEGEPPVMDVDPAPPLAPPPVQADVPLVEVAVGAGIDGDGASVSVAVGDGCTGLTAGSSTVGCETAPPETTGVVIATGGTAAPALDVHLP